MVHVYSRQTERGVYYLKAGRGVRQTRNAWLARRFYSGDQLQRWAEALTTDEIHELNRRRFRLSAVGPLFGVGRLEPRRAAVA